MKKATAAALPSNVPGVIEELQFSIKTLDGSEIGIKFCDFCASGPMTVLELQDGSTVCIIYDNEDRHSIKECRFIAIHEAAGDYHKELCQFCAPAIEKDRFAAQLQGYVMGYETAVKSL